MASSTSTDILQAIKGKGYWLRDDADIGKRADSILKPRFNIQSVEALELCKVAAFDNEDNWNVISAIFNEPVAVFYRGFGQTRRVHCFRNNVRDPITPEPSNLTLCLCSTGTRIIFYECTHIYRMNATNAPNGVLAIPEERLDEFISTKRVFSKEENLEQGGYILCDGRLGWKVLQGKVAFIGILERNMTATERWVGMPLPKSEDMVKVIGEMAAKSQTFCAHFEWIGDSG